MNIIDLSLVNFKNYSEVSVELHPKLNCFVGNNGMGKTNLLDAIYYLCMCKSYFNATDIYSIKQDSEFMVLQANFLQNQKEEEIYCGLKRNKKKQFRRNKKEYTKLSDHIGLFPVVMVSPSDIQLILDGSEERRKYINSVISQYNKNYLNDIINYNKVLAQRNKFLKDTQNSLQEQDLLDILDEQLIKLGNAIYKERISFIEQYIPVFSEYYSKISGGTEPVELIYQSQLTENDFADLLKQSRSRDFAVQFTTTGIHKDDLVLNLNGTSIRKTGSQGQQKTFLVSLKFAQFKFLATIKKILPLLLLDDVFDKLDSSRVKKILELVADNSFGQIFITHTSLEKMQSILNELNIDHKLFRVDFGKIEEITN
ncbi:MAG: DNA replication and repair protein RecF [Bacteroidales bacterium]|nr:DNA replication and repair protein RecF [Bacteroidales bacterium]